LTYSEQATAATQELDGELDEFLGALTALGGSAGNVRLREVLEWDDAAYNSVKAVLVDRGLIVPGRGRGGSVALAGDDEVGGAGDCQER
jgi:type I restriction enzyme M protein